jgi:hypothetical protein
MNEKDAVNGRVSGQLSRIYVNLYITGSGPGPEGETRDYAVIADVAVIQI